MTFSSTHNQAEYTVSEISGAVKRTMEDTFGYVRVRGEISGLKRAGSGHVYLDLKDDKAVLASVCWKGKANSLSFKPEDGLEVIASGKLTTFAGQSKYQLVIDSLEPAGIGALMAMLEERKKKLAAEGLFDPARKQPLPFMPQTIGVVTSPTGAVIRDIIHRITDRFGCHILVWPVRVQGQGAAEEIAEAVAGFNAMERKPDLLIVARGGGSIEDLWAFNEEVVVRAVAASQIPVISAVGHETDTTLIDYVSDKRAPTPTAAAEMAVPVQAEWRLSLQQWQQRLDGAMLQRRQRLKERVEGLARGIPAPSQLLQYATQRLDDLSERLARGLPQQLALKQQQLKDYSARLRPAPLQARLQQQHERLYELEQRANHAMHRQIERKQSALSLPASLLESLNYTQVLKRGFALVRGADDTLVSSQQEAIKQPHLRLIFHDGDMSSYPDPSASKPSRKRASSKKEDQPTLFS